MSKRSLSKSKYAFADVFRHRGIILRISMIIAVSSVMLAFTIKSNPLAHEDPLPDEPPFDELFVDEAFHKKFKKEKMPPESKNKKIKAVDNLTAATDLFGEVKKDFNLDLEGFLNFGDDSIPDEPEVEPYFAHPEIYPSFPGGDAAREDFVRDNLRWTGLATEFMSGSVRVPITFIISSKGKMKNIKIHSDPGYGMKAEILRMLKKMPVWIPGKMGEQSVSAPLSMSLRLTLSEY